VKNSEDDRFKLRPRPPRSRPGVDHRRFISRVIGAFSKAGGHPRGLLPSRTHTGGKFGRGLVAARLGGSGLGPRSRRVIVKMRLVMIKAGGARGIRAHLRYIQREGVGREGEPGQIYDRIHDTADRQAFEDRSTGDRHQFRFIIAPEDATHLGDLRGFTRELMTRVERDFGTTLEWVAVDHWDTDNPHTHLVLRGKDQAGRDLVIARDYIRHGMRRRACELASEWLGPRTDQELREASRHEVSQDRWTGLDQQLRGLTDDGLVRVPAATGAGIGADQRSRILGRLAHLQTMGLAQPVDALSWRLRADSEAVLRAMGERGDIVWTLQRAMGQETREPRLFDPATATQPVVGRIAAKGFADDLRDQSFVVIDGLDGHAHYVRLPASTDLAELPINGVADARATGDRTADRNILNAAAGGVYRTDVHLAQLRALPHHRDQAEDILDSHVRRLEALRRVGVVERLADGVWRVPDDLAARGRVYDRRRIGIAQVDVLSHLSVDRQATAVGSTWLDRQLQEGSAATWAPHGFAETVRSALRKRESFLVEQKLAERTGGRLILASDFIATLRALELEAAGRFLARETGLVHRLVEDGHSASGVYRRSVLLASGRFAMLDDGLGFSLVPWQRVIEPRLGQAMTAHLNGDRVSWRFGRTLGR
jgi:type IV secretory pathway VirD2 relaxase